MLTWNSTIESPLLAPMKDSSAWLLGQRSCTNTFCFSAAAAKSLQLCPTLCDPIDGSPPSSAIPGILQGKNTGVGCHFLLQCMKVKIESEVTQSCLTLSDPMDCSLPGSCIHGIFQARVLEWVAIAFSEFSIWCLVKKKSNQLLPSQCVYPRSCVRFD